MRMLLAAVAATLLAVPATSQEHEGCPLMARAAARQAQVDHRHQETTDVPSAGTEHHFVLSEDGGTIRLEVKDPADTAARDAVRAHLRHIARAFAEGDFSMPLRIHEQVPPGVEAMKARRASIRYSYSETPNGGAVSIATKDPDARAAVHEFLRFQVRDHGTKDPTE